MSVDETGIRQLSDLWVASVRRGDSVELAKLLTDDVVVIHGNGRQLTGKQAVIEDFAHSFTQFSVEQEIVPEETIVAGEWAFERARVHTVVTSRSEGTPQELDSRTLTIMRRAPRLGWLIARVIGAVVQSKDP